MTGILQRLSYLSGRDLFPLLFLSAISGVYYLVLLSMQEFPVVTPDGKYYLKLAEEMIGGRFPETLHRTPLYPAVLVPFLLAKSLSGIVYFQILLSIFSVYLIFRISALLTGNMTISLIFSLLCIFDFNFYQFQYFVLTETLATFLLLSFIYIQVKLVSDQADRKLTNILGLGAGVLLIFLRPQFLLLPCLIYLFMAVSLLPRKTRPGRMLLRYSLAGIALNLFFILSYCTVNKYRYDSFVFSDVSKINLLGKALNNGYINSYQLRGAEPALIRETVSYVKKSNPQSPYEILTHLGYFEKNRRTQLLDSLNNYFFMNNSPNMLGRDLKDLLNLITGPSYSYMDIQNIRSSGILIHASFLIIDKIKSILSPLILMIIPLFIIVRKKRIRFVCYGIIVGSAFYTLVLSVLLSHSERSRLTSPAEPIISLIFLILFYELKNLKKLAKN